MAGAKKKTKPAKKQSQSKQGKDLNEMTVAIQSLDGKRFKVKLPIRIAVIVLSVIALSWFFEGCRQIKAGITLAHVAVLFGGTVSTLFLLWLQAFWIYVEEKSKGTLKRKVVHFDKLEEYWLEGKKEQRK